MSTRPLHESVESRMARIGVSPVRIAELAGEDGAEVKRLVESRKTRGEDGEPEDDKAKEEARRAKARKEADGEDEEPEDKDESKKIRKEARRLRREADEKDDEADKKDDMDEARKLRVSARKLREDADSKDKDADEKEKETTESKRRAKKGEAVPDEDEVKHSAVEAKRKARTEARAALRGKSLTEGVRASLTESLTGAVRSERTRGQVSEFNEACGLVGDIAELMAGRYREMGESKVGDALIDVSNAADALSEDKALTEGVKSARLAKLISAVTSSVEEFEKTISPPAPAAGR